LKPQYVGVVWDEKLNHLKWRVFIHVNGQRLRLTPFPDGFNRVVLSYFCRKNLDALTVKPTKEVRSGNRRNVV
jgi:hypothetical protein